MTFEEWWDKQGLLDGTVNKPAFSMREWFRDAYEEGYREAQNQAFRETYGE